jgi:rRNA maturation endonuclease Nob1
VFDKREAIGAGNVNGDGGVIKKEVGKKESADKPLTWGTECAKCKKPWDRYIGKRHCYTCGVPIL